MHRPSEKIYIKCDVIGGSAKVLFIRVGSKQTNLSKKYTEKTTTGVRLPRWLATKAGLI